MTFETPKFGCSRNTRGYEQKRANASLTSPEGNVWRMTTFRRETGFSLLHSMQNLVESGRIVTDAYAGGIVYRIRDGGRRPANAKFA